MRTITLAMIALSTVLLFSCHGNKDCVRISKKHLSGSWLVNKHSVNGVNAEVGNASFLFSKDGNYEGLGETGKWDFGPTNNVLLIETETESFQLDVIEFSKTDMIFWKTLGDNQQEFSLSKAL